MLTEIYAWEIFRDMEAEISQSLRGASVSTGISFTFEELIRCAGVALRRSGQRLESWASPREPRSAGIPAELMRPIRG